MGGKTMGMKRGDMCCYLDCRWETSEEKNYKSLQTTFYFQHTRYGAAGDKCIRRKDFPDVLLFRTGENRLLGLSELKDKFHAASPYVRRKKKHDRRRLGWKPSHDIPRRH